MALRWAHRAVDVLGALGTLWILLGGWWSAWPLLFGTLLLLLSLPGRAILFELGLHESRVRQEAERQQAQFHAAFMGSPVPMTMFSLHPRAYLDVNPAWESLTGYRRADVLGDQPERFGLFAHHHEAAQVVADLARGLPVVDRPIEIRHASGEILHILLNVSRFELDGQSCSFSVMRDISELRRQQTRLQSMQTRLQAIFDASPDGLLLVTKADSLLLDANASAVRLLGQDLLLRRGMPLPQDRWWGRSPSYAISKAQLEVEGRLHRVPLRLEEPDQGLVLDMEVSVVSVQVDAQDCWLVVMRDISSEVRLRKTLAKLAETSFGGESQGLAQDWVRELRETMGLDHGTLGIWSAANPTPIILLAHQMDAPLMNESERGQPLTLTDALEHLKPYLVPNQLWWADVNGPELSTPEHVYWRQQGRRWVAAVCLVDAHNQPSGMIVVSDRLPLARREMLDSLLRVFAVRVSNELERIKVDHALRELNMDLEQRVTQRTQQLQAANEELRELLDRLKQAQNELIRSEKLAALGALVAGVAHEMSTPIGNGLMVSSTLKEHATEFADSLKQGIRRSQLERFIDETRTSSDIILRNLERAGTLLSSFKQVAVDQTSSQRRRFDLAQVLGEVFLTLRPTLKQWPGQLENRVPEGLLMDSYPGPLGQVVSNFVNNALLHAYDPGQGGTMTVSAKVDGDWVRLDFQDDGKGIAPEHLSRVFDPFFTTRLGQGGSGLGLHICHNIVTQLLGGSLDVSSESGQGTCFHLTLPLRAPQSGSRELPP